MDDLTWQITAAASPWMKKEDGKQLWLSLRAARSQLFVRAGAPIQEGGGIRLGELAAAFGGIVTKKVPREQYLRERAARANPERAGGTPQR